MHVKNELPPEPKSNVSLFKTRFSKINKNLILPKCPKKTSPLNRFAGFPDQGIFLSARLFTDLNLTTSLSLFDGHNSIYSAGSRYRYMMFRFLCCLKEVPQCEASFPSLSEQCSGSVEFVSFWASWIRIQIRNLFVRIRI